MPQSKTQTFFRGISVQSVFTATMGILEIVVFSVMSRLLSKEEFGYYAALSGIITIFGSIANAGFGASIIQKKDATKNYIATAFRLSCFAGLLCALIIFILAPYLASLVADNTLSKPMRIMAFTVFLNSLVGVGLGVLYRQLSFIRIGVILTVAYIMSSSIGIILAYYGCGLYSIVVFGLLNPLFSVLMLFPYLLNAFHGNFEKSSAKNIFNFGGWLTLGVIINTITQQLDKLLLSHWISVKALGAYNRPTGFVTTIAGKIQNIFDTVLFPMLSGIQDNKEKIISVFYTAVSLLNSCSILLALIFFFNAELIIFIFFGSNWADMIPVMQIVSIGIIFSIDGQLVDCFFRSLNLVKIGFYLRLFGLLISIIGIYIGSSFGVQGVAIAIVISNIFIIVVKMIVLSILVNASVQTMLSKWFIAWKPALIPSFLGILYIIIIPHSLMINICILILQILIIALECLLFPKFLGNDYSNLVYPMIKKKILANSNINKLFK